MNIEAIREYCIGKPGVEETMPFGPDVVVYKVKGKIFLLMPLEAEQFRISIKCDPAKAIELREQYASVIPGYHLNKKHWNTVAMDGSVSFKLVKEWIDHSYELVSGAAKKR